MESEGDDALLGSDSGLHLFSMSLQLKIEF